MIPVYLKRFAKILMLLLLVICTQANIPSVNAETAEDYQNQINSYTAQIESNPNDATLYYNRGVAYMKLFDIKFNDSEKEIFKQKRPFEEVKSMLEGIQYLRKNAYDDFDNAITLNQYYAEAYYARGMVYITKDFLDKPFAVLARYPGDNVEDFEKAILLKPDYTEAYNGCSKAYYMLADFALDLEKVKKIDSIEANTQMNSCINNLWQYNLTLRTMNIMINMLIWHSYFINTVNQLQIIIKCLNSKAITLKFMKNVDQCMFI